jgi:hypothetical protein
MGRSRDQRQQFLNRANSDIAPCAGCGRGPLFVAQKSQFEILIVVMKPHPRPRIALLRREPSLPHTPHLAPLRRGLFFATPGCHLAHFLMACRRRTIGLHRLIQREGCDVPKILLAQRRCNRHLCCRDMDISRCHRRSGGASTSGRPRLGYTTAARASGTLTPFACPAATARHRLTSGLREAVQPLEIRPLLPGRCPEPSQAAFLRQFFAAFGQTG